MLGSGWRSSDTRIRIQRSSTGSIPIIGNVFAMGGAFTYHVGPSGAGFNPRFAHDFPLPPDEKIVSSFLRHAEEIFSAALQGGADDCQWDLLVNPDGAIRMVAGHEWGLEPLRIDHGAHEAFRVTRTGGRVRVEARSAVGSCCLESGRAAAAIRGLFSDFPQYQTVR